MVAPTVPIKACLLEDPLSDCDNVTCSFGERNYNCRWDQTSLRVLPTQKRFDTLNAPIAGIHHWLVFEQELPPSHRVSQVSFQRVNVFDTLLLVHIKDLVIRTALTFHLVHGHVCSVDESLRCVAGMGKGDADAG